MIDEKLQEHRIAASRRCPSCGHELNCIPDMAGLPAGVKFDPTDQELIEHLEAKVIEGGSRSHPLIDDFIPTIQGEDGICYTHPEKLPGVTRNGMSKHFFHMPSNAYTTGTRKRRKIQAECDLPNIKNISETRWHKTGKTRPLMVAGQQKGCKKILVLYVNFGRDRKPEKTNWVMHQYHLGNLGDEKEGQLIVSKVFYQTQPRHNSAVDQCTRVCGTEPETPRAVQDGLTGYAAAAAAALEVQRQQQQKLKQADGQFSSAPPEKRLHEVGVNHQVAVDQGEENDQHHTPSQRDVCPNFQAMPAPTTSSLTKLSNLVSTIASPAIQHTSVVLNSRLDSPAMLIRNENFRRGSSNSGRNFTDRSDG